MRKSTCSQQQNQQAFKSILCSIKSGFIVCPHQGVVRQLITIRTDCYQKQTTQVWATVTRWPQHYQMYDCRPGVWTLIEAASLLLLYKKRPMAQPSGFQGPIKPNKLCCEPIRLWVASSCNNKSHVTHQVCSSLAGGVWAVARNSGVGWGGLSPSSPSSAQPPYLWRKKDRKTERQKERKKEQW